MKPGRRGMMFLDLSHQSLTMQTVGHVVGHGLAVIIGIPIRSRTD